MSKSSILVYLQFFCIAWILLNTAAWLAHPWYWLMMEIMGVIIGVWAVISIQFPNLSIFPEPKQGSELIEHGPYRWIRHPMYLSVLLVCLALVSSEWSLPKGLVCGALFIVLLLKIQLEEASLIEYFPEYKAYAERTWRLLPFVY